MKAAIFKEKNRLRVEEIPEPKPGEHEIIMKVSYCAICGSDLHRYTYGMMKPGTIMGHEFSGVVEEIGKQVRNFKVGDRVSRCGGKITRGRELPNIPPRYSARERGFLPLKPGAYAQYLAIHEDQVIKTPNEISDLDASLIEPLTVAVHMVRISGIRLGDQVVVLGAGPIGLFAQQCASLAGALGVYVSDIHPLRLKAALELGAHQVFNPTEIDLVKEIVQRTEIGADVALECAGAQPTLQQALELVRIGGRVMVASLAWEPVECLPVQWVGREVEMKTCYGALNSEWLISLALLQEKKIQTKPMVSKIVPLAEIQEAFLELLDPRNTFVQVVVQCN
jgi:threonine dehydrogenase-like Zn-dependent dehydrogenase